MREEFKNAGCSASDCSSCCESCGSGQNQIPNTISLTLDDNTEVECAILTIFRVKEKEYSALLPLDIQKKKESLWNNSRLSFFAAFIYLWCFQIHHYGCLLHRRLR